MPMYNLFEYGHNYCVRSGGLWNCYRDKIDDVDLNDNASDGQSIKYKTKIIGETPEKTSQSRNPADADQAA